jgi:hypothetical protein
LQVGVWLFNLIPDELHTMSLFDDDDRQQRLSRVIDELNQRFGKSAVFNPSRVISRRMTGSGDKSGKSRERRRFQDRLRGPGKPASGFGILRYRPVSSMEVGACPRRKKILPFPTTPLARWISSPRSGAKRLC